MKSHLLSMVVLGGLLVSCQERVESQQTMQEEDQVSQEVSNSINADIVRLLDNGELSKAMALANSDESVRGAIDILFMDCSSARYDAVKVIEEGKVIILQGRFWIRSGKTLIDGRQSDDSFAIIHKKTMRVIAVAGEYEKTILLAD